MVAVEREGVALERVDAPFEEDFALLGEVHLELLHDRLAFERFEV